MIEITNLSFSYRKQPTLFSGLSLNENPGSIIGLLGKNGAGKSTLLKLITGLLKVQENSISVMGEIPFSRNPAFLEEVCFIPEEYDLPSIKIREYVKAYSVFYPRFSHKKLADILLGFELDSSSSLSKLSYGQKKKFLIAFALATNCRLLILDEPTNGLDIPSKAIFRRVVAGSLNEDQLVIISTHQVKDVENLIDKIVILDSGRIILQQSVLEISDKYAFMVTNSSDEKDILYHEVDPGGYKVIKPCNGVITEVDIELLFNAAISGIQFN
jgi:ABC-2 type transport system ATP-binding protein